LDFYNILHLTKLKNWLPYEFIFIKRKKWGKQLKSLLFYSPKYCPFIFSFLQTRSDFYFCIKALSLISSKISYKKFLKLLELIVSGDAYAELVNTSYSDTSSFFSKTLNEWHYDRSINSRRIYRFLLINLWSEQDKHQYFSNSGKIWFIKPTFAANFNVKKFAVNNIRFIPQSLPRKQKM
jgi:hypothetical protein